MFDDDDQTTEAHERRIVRCKTCRARIIFLRTGAGKKIPVDADTVEPEDKTFDHERHVSHFATCSEADHFRRRG